MIIQSFILGPFQENGYLIADTDQKIGAVIDPGSEPEKINAAISKLDLSVQSVFNTHGHIDHIGAIEDLRRSHQIKFYLHRDDEPLIQKAEQYAAMYDLPFDTIPKVDHYLSDGDEFLIGDLKMKIIHTPGHTPGCCCFYFQEQNVIFTGDTLFRESIGRTDLPGGHHPTILQSITEKLFVLPDDTIVYPGHGPQTTIGHEKLNNPFL